MKSTIPGLIVAELEAVGRRKNNETSFWVRGHVRLEPGTELRLRLSLWMPPWEEDLGTPPRRQALNVVPPTRSPGPLSGKKGSMVVPSSLNLNKPWPFPECLCKAKFKDTKMEMILSVTLRGRLVTGPPLLP